MQSKTKNDPTGEAAKAIKLKGLFKNPDFILLIFGIAIIVVISLFIPNFMTWRNVSNIIVQASSIGIMALGLTFVLITAGNDLSLPTVMTLAAILGCIVMRNTQSVFLGVAVIILIGAFVGAINGLSVAKFKMVPMIVTLAMATIASGLSNWITGAKSIGGLPQSFKQVFAGSVLGVPVPAIILVLIAVIMHLILSRTVFGRQLLQVGANEKTAKINGVNTERVIFLCYLISGILAGVAGTLGAAKLSSAGPSLGTQDKFTDIICAVVIGGTSVSGGKGTIIGTVVGAIFMTVITNVMNLYGVDYYITYVIKGAAIILFTYLDYVRNKIGERR